MAHRLILMKADGTEEIEEFPGWGAALRLGTLLAEHPDSRALASTHEGVIVFTVIEKGHPINAFIEEK